MALLDYVTGRVVLITDAGGSGRDECSRRITIQTADRGRVNIIMEPTTQVFRSEVIRMGDQIAAFYNPRTATLLLSPPQYWALFIVRLNRAQSIKADRFNNQLISSDNSLRLNLARNTNITLTNGQPFQGNLAGRFLIVLYTAATFSIPAQTTPQNVIVICNSNLS